MLRLWAGAAWARADTGTDASAGMAVAAKAVMTLVRLAGGNGSWSLPASTTWPVSASTTIHALGGGGGAGGWAGAVGCDRERLRASAVAGAARGPSTTATANISRTESKS